MKRCDVAFGEWKPARNSGRVGNISLCQRVLVACCNKSPAQLEALMRSYQADDRLFLPSNADAEEVLKIIDEFGGVLPFNDKASPEIIKREAHMSKNAFKRAVGHLYKERLIEFTEKGIRRV